MLNLLKLRYSPTVFDGLFATSGILSLVGIVLSTSRAYPAIAPAGQPLMKGGSIVGVILLANLIAALSVRRDQALADDFLYQTLCKSAFIALCGLFFTLILWQLLFLPILGGVSTHTAIGIVIASWSLAYFYTRIKGTGL